MQYTLPLATHVHGTPVSGVTLYIINDCINCACIESNVSKYKLLTTVLQWLAMVRHRSHFLVVDSTVHQSQLLTLMIPLLFTFSFMKPFLVQFFLRNTRLVY